MEGGSSATPGTLLASAGSRSLPLQENPFRSNEGCNSLAFKKMRKVNVNNLEEFAWTSPKGKFASVSKLISEGLGRKDSSTDLMERHPFDIEIARIPAGKMNCPYHSHSAQWEFYYVISGSGIARDDAGQHAIESGDAFIYKPSEAHQLINNSEDELVLFVVADNPIGESGYYPDSKKWLVRSPERTLIRSNPLDYFDGEE
jgi:uncharacterized cupin superfamily protein